MNEMQTNNHDLLHIAIIMDSVDAQNITLPIDMARWDYLYYYIAQCMKFYYQIHSSNNPNNDIVDICTGPVWFSYKSMALPWHYPVGLLHDILVTSMSDNIPDSWTIRVHMNDKDPYHFPGHEYQDPCNDLMEDVFLSQCRQGEYLYKGKISSFNHIKTFSWTRRDIQSYWNLIRQQRDNLSKFYLEQLDKTLICKDHHGIFLPFRLYYVENTHEPSLGIQISCLFPEPSAQSTTNSIDQFTLKEFVDYIMYKEWIQKSNNESDCLNSIQNNASRNNYDIIIHGRKNDPQLLGMDIWTVYGQYAFPTYFLYIVIVDKDMNIKEK